MTWPKKIDKDKYKDKDKDNDNDNDKDKFSWVLHTQVPFVELKRRSYNDADTCNENYKDNYDSRGFV